MSYHSGMTTIMVTGSREYADISVIEYGIDLAWDFIVDTIDAGGPGLLIHGGAAGADSLADRVDGPNVRTILFTVRHAGLTE